MRKLLPALLACTLLLGCGLPNSASRGAIQSKAAKMAGKSLSKSANIDMVARNLMKTIDDDGNEYLDEDELPMSPKASAVVDGFVESEAQAGAAVGDLPIDGTTAVDIGVGGGVLAGYLTWTGVKLSNKVLHPAKASGTGAGNATLVSDNLKLAATYQPADVQTTKAVVLRHPLGTSKETMADYAAFLKKGYNTLALDFRNHGTSEGTLTSGGAAEAHDVQAAVGFLKRKGNTEIAVLGVGRGAVTGLAAPPATLTSRRSSPTAPTTRWPTTSWFARRSTTAS